MHEEALAEVLFSMPFSKEICIGLILPQFFCLTSCIATRSSVYFANWLAAVVSEFTSVTFKYLITS